MRAHILKSILKHGFVFECGAVFAFTGFYFAYTLLRFDHDDFAFAASAHMSGTLYQDIHYVQAPPITISGTF
jgi:hypothetical protein